MADPWRVKVAVDAPRHSGLTGPLDYASEHPLAPGTLVRVPLGKRDVPGIVWPGGDEPALDADLRPVGEVLADLPPLSPAWCALVGFAADYYQRSIGEVALSVLPPELRQLGSTQVQRRIAHLLKAASPLAASVPAQVPPPSEEQAAALAQLAASETAGTPRPVLLHGATGSGKTEVYLRAAESALASGRQALILVPEINLTPQLEARFAERFGAGPSRGASSRCTAG